MVWGLVPKWVGVECWVATVVAVDVPAMVAVVANGDSMVGYGMVAGMVGCQTSLGVRMGRNGWRSDLYLPLPLPLGLLSFRGRLVAGWDKMSVSWMVSWRMSVLASLKVTPERICMASCHEKVFHASLTCGILSACRRTSCSQRWM